MRTLLKTLVATMLLLVFTGPAAAAVLTAGSSSVDLGVAGNPLIPGSAVQDSFGLHVTGGGSAIGGNEDHGFFLYAEVAGDGYIIAKVDSFSAAYTANRVAGVMVRQSLDADAVNVANFVMPSQLLATLVYHSKAQARTSEGGGTTVIASDPGAGVGSYIMLDRTGDTITFSWFNGSAWTPYAAPITVPMTGTVYVGLAVSAGDNSISVSPVFDPASVYYSFTGVSTMVWDNLGSDTWVSPSWIGTQPYPGVTEHVLLDADCTDTVYVSTGDQDALSLTIEGGKVMIEAGRTLTIGEDVTVGPNGLLELGAGATIAPARGGTISHLTASAGDATLKTWAGETVEVTHFGGNIFSSHPGVFTLQGGGTLQLDNLAGNVVAPYTTFDIEAGGTLASKGANALGGAQEVILQGARLEVENAGAISMSTALTVPTSSTVNVDAAGTSMGRLTIDDATLTTSGTGGISFDDTDITAGSSLTFQADTDTDIGAVNLPGNAVTIEKRGAAKLIVSGTGTNLANANFRVYSGTLVGVNSSDPFGPNTITLSGGELVLANSTPDVGVFDNALTLTSSSTLSAGNAGLDLDGLKSVQIGSATKGVNMGGSNRTLTLRSTDGYLLDVAGVLSNAGRMNVTGGNVLLSGGGQFHSGNLTDGTLTTTAALSTTSTSTAFTVSGGDLITMAPFSVPSNALRVTSGSATIGDTLGVKTLDIQGGVTVANGVVTASTLTASAGSLSLVNTANVGDAVLSGTAVVSANNLVISKSLKRGDTTYSVTTGSFTATGSDLLNGIDLAFGGTAVTVVGPGPQTDANITVTANGSLAANTTARASFSSLTLNSGVTNLTLTTSAPKAVSVGDLVAADGTGITGALVVRDDVIVGDSPGTLDIVGNLTLANTSVYNWELGPDGSDLINVSNSLTLTSGWTLKIVSDDSYYVPSSHTLFTFGNSVWPSVPTFDLSEADGWGNTLSLRVTFNPTGGGGSVMLDVVPEPATWAMLLGAGLLGVVGIVRRRRKSA